MSIPFQFIIYDYTFGVVEQMMIEITPDTDWNEIMKLEAERLRRENQDKPPDEPDDTAG